MANKEQMKARYKIKLCVYPNIKNFALFIVHCRSQNKTRSEMLRSIISDYINKLPTNVQNEYLQVFKGLTEKQIMYTNSNDDVN